MTNARSVFVITIIIIMNTGTAVYPRHSTVMPLMLHTCLLNAPRNALVDLFMKTAQAVSQT